MAESSILDQYGKRFKTNGHARKELVEHLSTRSRVAATYDAAQDRNELKNYWANADSYDADSANSFAVRSKLVPRSRYEIANNGYADGIAQTYATDLIGKGPSLRMQTASEGFNRMVETEWARWAKVIHFRRKLWTLAHAKHGDGEGFGVIRRNRGVRHPLKIDLRLYETEQFQTPLLNYGVEGYIDGIKFDADGNIEWYDLLSHHPGSSDYTNLNLTPERIRPEFVLHWFKMRRPGQHRGVPESASTLNCGGAARRWREAVLAAAENIADFSLFIKTMFEPDTVDQITPLSTIDIQKRMMTALPNGWDAFQPRAEQPTATHAEFSKTLINEQARPRSMPYNKAAMDSSDYNYASGRLDHQTYYAELDVDREDCNDLVLDPMFDVWFDLAVVNYGWLGGNPTTLTDGARSHLWDWPKHRVADIKAEADANDKKLKNGTTTLPALYSDEGRDYEDELVKQATANGISVDQQRQINMLVNLPQHAVEPATRILGLAETTTNTESLSDGKEEESP